MKNNSHLISVELLEWKVKWNTNFDLFKPVFLNFLKYKIFSNI